MSSRRGQSDEGIEYSKSQGLKVLDVARQDRETVTLRRRADDDIGETRRMAPPSCPVCNRAGDPRYGSIKNENPITV